MAEKIRVLYVDDERALLDLGTVFLEKTGEFTLNTLTSAQEALSFIRDHPVDAIISDYQMPEMDGIEFLKAVRARGDKTPFIIFTGKGREEVVIQALNSGADFYLQKGGESKAQFAELSNKIRYAVSRKRVEGALKVSEERFRQLFSGMPSGVAIYEAVDDGEDFVFRDFNAAGEAIEHVKNEEVIGRRVIDVFPGVKEFGILSVFQRVWRTGKPEFFPSAVYRDARDPGTWRENWVYRLRTGEIVAIYNDITDRKVSEQALIKSQVQLAEAMDLAHIVNWEFDVASGIFTFNDRFYTLYGTTAEREGGYQMPAEVYAREFVHPDEVGVVSDEVQKAITTTDPNYTTQTEHRIIRRDGECRHIIVRFGITKDARGMTVKTHGANQDITDRKRIEQALKRSEERYRSVVEDQTEFICRFTPDGKLTFVNDAYCRYFSLNKDRCLARPHSVVLSPEDVRQMKQHLASLTRENPVATIEHRIIMPSGEVRWQRWNDRAIFDGNGTVVEYQSVGRDITEIKNAEKSLLEREAYYRAIFENTGTASVIVEEDTTISLANEEFAVLSGYPREEIEGKRCWTEFVVKVDLERMLAQHHSRRKDRKQAERHYEFRFARKSGEVRNIFLSIDVIPGTKKSIASLLDITDRKRAEESLRQSEERFRALAENASDIIRILDREGRIVFDTAASERILGYLPGFSIGRSPYEFVHPDDLAMVKQKLSAVYTKTNPGVPIEFRIRRADGSYTWVESLGKNLIGIPGIDGIVITTRFIDDRKKAEEALRESEERYRALVDNALEAILIFDFSGTALFANHATVTLVDVDDPHALIGRNVLEFIAPESRDTVLADFASVMEGRDAYLAYYKVITATGREKWVEAIGKKIQFGGAPADIVMLRDITERKQVEDALRESEEKFRTLAESCPFAIAIYQSDYWVYTNPAGEQISGYSADELYTMHYWDFVAPEFQEFVKEAGRKRQTRESVPTSYDFRIITKDESEKWVALSGSPITFRGSPAGLITVVDITERKRAEEALRQANKQLNLLSSITRHDIKNQLLALRGYLELSRDYLDDKTRLSDFLAKEEKAATTIEHQIMFTRDYQELGAVAPAWQNVNECISTAMAALPMRDVRVAMDSKSPEIFADPLLERVFYNLIDNALRYGGADMKTIRVSSTEHDTGLTIVCEDDGVGISAEDKKRLFTRGFGKNTGLGLFLSREILAITGITITENGTPGKGARFEITVPKGMWRMKGASE